MGYESKIYIVERYTGKNATTGEDYANGIIVASYDLCKAGYNNHEFYEAFRTPIDYTLWLPTFDKDGNEVMGEVDEDCYGEHLKSADLLELLDALNIAEEREHYRRFPPLIAMIEALVDARDDWDDANSTLQAVHFGY